MNLSEIPHGTCLDVESTGLCHRDDRLLCCGFEYGKSIRIEGPEGHFSRKYIADPACFLIGSNVGFDAKWFIGDRELPMCRLLDLGFLHSVLDESYPQRGLKHLTLLYTDYKDYKPNLMPWEMEEHRLYEYLARDVVASRAVYNGIIEELDLQKREYKLLVDFMSTVQPVLTAMEHTGIQIDRKELGKVRLESEESIRCLENDVRTIATNHGVPALDYDSPQQLSDFIFGTLGCKVPRIQKAIGLNGKPSTRKEALEKVDHEFTNELVKLRSARTNYRAFVLNIEKRLTDEARVHCSINTYRAATGRLSIDNPPIHGIPKGHPIRRAIVPFDPDCGFLVQQDLSQAELRVLAHVSGDEGLLEAFRSGVDVHAATAADIYSILAGSVTESQRTQAKTINFGILYGLSAKGLAPRIETTVKEAQSLIDAWFRARPGVVRYQRKVELQAANDGVSETSYGRCRHYPAIDLDCVYDYRSRSHRYRAPSAYWEGERYLRQAKNHELQAVASDLNLILLRDMARLHSDYAWPIAIIHDSVLWSVDTEDDKEQLLVELEDYFGVDYLTSVQETLGITLNVPLVADLQVGKTWSTMEEVGSVSTS